jgi:hypothetical protein
MKKKTNSNSLVDAVMTTTPEVRNLYLGYISYTDHIVETYCLCMSDAENRTVISVADERTIRRLLAIKRDCLVGIRTIEHLEDRLFSGDRPGYNKFSKRYLAGYKKFTKNIKTIDTRVSCILDKVKEANTSSDEIEL